LMRGHMRLPMSRGCPVADNEPFKCEVNADKMN
jgi:hypothetical protein